MPALKQKEAGMKKRIIRNADSISKARKEVIRNVVRAVHVVPADETQWYVLNSRGNKEQCPDRSTALRKAMGITPPSAGIILHKRNGTIVRVVDHADYVKLTKRKSHPERPFKVLDFETLV